MTSSTPGLDAIAAARERLTGEPTSAKHVAYEIRQIHTAVGCHHSCSHCFASPPARQRVMALDGFARLASEFGYVTRRTGAPYEFLFLGSATDPSSVPGFAEYLAIWLDAMGDASPTRLYTHGWLLGKPGQVKELDATANVLARHVDAIEMVNVSIDRYSALARRDGQGYEENIAANICRLLEAVGRAKIRFHVLYPVERHKAASSTLIGAQTGNELDRALTALAAPEDPNDRACAALTASVLRIGQQVGFNVDDTVAHSRDAGMPMAVGRAVGLFRRASVSAREEGLAWYRRKALPRLRETVGLQVFPNGSVRVIDYDGYQDGPWLDGGDQVVDYLEITG